MFMRFKVTIFLSIILISCQNSLEKAKKQGEIKVQKTENQRQTDTIKEKEQPVEIVVGANKTEQYFPLIRDKNIAITTNQTGVITKNNKVKAHIVDSLISRKINISKIFCPEHGFRGDIDAGKKIKNSKDEKTGLEIVSLYGKNKKPTSQDLKEVDCMVFDIQDVGARFYTYLSTLHYVMEACAENNIPLIVLDRPNPNGAYVDGPVMEPCCKSFVGMHPVPILYGMTIGEYAMMINGEGWLKNGKKCDLKVIKLENYTHKTNYSLPVAPSPNLPNDKSINLYPSLCLFEGTNVSVGRGTNMQFQIYGSPYIEKGEFSFTPEPKYGSKKPMHNGIICYGKNLSEESKLKEIKLKWLIEAYENTKNKTNFFNKMFDLLAGNKELKKQIENNKSEKEIKKSWEKELNKFKKIRNKYLLYE